MAQPAPTIARRFAPSCGTGRHLESLKGVYLKLRQLVDAGAIFVGHGLKTDFEIINLVVPPEQVRCTAATCRLNHAPPILFESPHSSIVVRTDTHLQARA